MIVSCICGALLLVRWRRQQQPRASLSIETLSAQVHAGEIVVITTHMQNLGRIGLGLPQYRLYVETDNDQPALEPDHPQPVEHYLQVGPGQSDSAVFELQAVRPGTATLRSTVSFEVHLGYPGPAHWGGASAGPIVVTVVP